MFYLYAILAFVIGGLIGYLVRQQIVSKRATGAEQKAIKILEEAKTKEKEILLEAKSKALEMTDQAKKTEQDFRDQLVKFEERVDRREVELAEKEKYLLSEKQQLEQKVSQVDLTLAEVKETKAKQLATLEKIAGLSKEEAGKVLLENAEKAISEEMILLHRKLLTSARDSADKEAKRIVTQAIERVVSEVTSETTTTTVALPSEDLKGRIIGKEGRNIRAFEQMMGVEILIDDSPDTVVLSGFNSIRRHIAKRTLERLVVDGRIHPARIEEAYEKSRAEINEEIKQAGEQACYELGITNFPPKLMHLVGRLQFRTSYGQNVLRHSVEMAKLSALMAEELGADVSIAKQGALLHDIGKALDQDLEGTHVEIGRKIAEKFGLDTKVIEAIESHHHDTDVAEHAQKHDHPLSLEAMIVDAADTISGGRPGARKDNFENYIKRLTDLENIATAFPGVEKAYAIQGGRELRTFVTATQVSDVEAQKMAREIANRLQNELNFPGEIRVVVIRETRVVEYAR